MTGRLHAVTGLPGRLTIVGLVVSAALVAPPLIGRPAVTRVGAIMGFAAAALIAIARPWRWTSDQWSQFAAWQPSRRVLLVGAIVGGACLSWIVLTRFQSAEINAVDFTVYFDRPSFQTAHGRPLFVETADVPDFSHRSEFAVHSFWMMVPIGCLYLLHATPFWLLAISVLAVVIGALYVVRILQQVGIGGAVACAAGIAFALNDNTARTLNYGFHPEVLYAWFVPWLIHSGLRGAVGSFVLAAVLCVLVKEDACLPLFAATVALWLVDNSSVRRERRILLSIVPVALALVNLVGYYSFILPRLVADGKPTYSVFWANYGATPFLAMRGMMLHPLDVIGRTLTAGLAGVLAPHLYLPIVGWPWSVGTLPTIVLYGASVNPRLRAFDLYYAIPLVPFFVIASAAGASLLTTRLSSSPGKRDFLACTLVIAGAVATVLVAGGYSLRPWRREVGSVAAAARQFRSDPVVLVQNGLFPHVGYDSAFQLLTAESLRDAHNKNGIVLLAPALSAYPLSPDELHALAALEPVASMPPGLIAVRVPESAAGLPPFHGR